ncbi:hypothetical protein ACM918_003574 [Cronobacter malonaticus]|uniref:hypothetical protein n=1 Tax=Cronobacter malonaticus TaxID=413503 RepID=UPI001F1F6320|nr:hypothetical protein [Cronobacter malonaticus]MDT3582804.1 hypothetical protein [Cronobacter malonaticus]
MMTVKEVLDNCANDNKVYLDGYLIYHSDGDLSLIDKDYGNNYLKAPFLKIKNKELSDNLESNVSLYGGGSSRLFHYAKVKGRLFIDDDENHYLDIEELMVEDGGRWHFIDLNKQYESRSSDGITWDDIFKKDDV